MPHAADTGNGATVSLSTSGLSAPIYSIKIGDQSINMLDISALEDTGFMKKLAGDLVEPGEVEIEYEYQDNFVEVTGNDTDPETLTVTFPSDATLSGTGKVSKSGGIDLQNNVVQRGKITFSFDGLTGPTFA